VDTRKDADGGKSTAEPTERDRRDVLAFIWRTLIFVYAGYQKLAFRNLECYWTEVNSPILLRFINTVNTADTDSEWLVVPPGERIWKFRIRSYAIYALCNFYGHRPKPWNNSCISTARSL